MSEYPAQQINRLRKEGHLKDAWDIGCIALKEQTNDKFLKGAFFWVCYDYLKEVQIPITERGKTNGNFNPNEQEFERIESLLGNVMWLNIDTGGFEYSRLFQLFRKNMSCFPSLVRCLLNNQDAMFSDEDKEPYKVEKGESPSLMLSCARQLAKAWMEHAKKWDLPIDAVISVLNKTRAQVHDNQHKIWLDYDEAKCLIVSGRFDEARIFAISVLKRKQSEAWAWGALAATYRKENIDAAITLFSQGLCNCHEEKFALRLLKGIAPLLAENGFTKEASMCVLRAEKCYQENGWKIKLDLENLSSQSWMDRTVKTNDLTAFLSQKSQGASDYLFGPMKSVIGLVINLHKSGKGLHLYLSEEESISIALRMFKGNKVPVLGDYAMISLSGNDEDETVVAAEIISPHDLPGVEYYKDTLNVTDKGFGFIGDTFIPASLIQDGMDKQVIKVLRYKDFDKKKNRIGWRGISLQACD